VEKCKNDNGEFYRFELLSYCPIDLRGVDSSLLEKREIDWLNEYHKNVYEKLSPYLTEEEKAWLKEETRAI
jgi:Xaa-Pro aminopeptidase